MEETTITRFVFQADASVMDNGCSRVNGNKETGQRLALLQTDDKDVNEWDGKKVKELVRALINSEKAKEVGLCGSQEQDVGKQESKG